MSRKLIPAADVIAHWRHQPALAAAHDGLDDEYALASALMEARSRAGMTQAEVAQAMGTTQAVVARLESGGSLPSTRTLARFARATRSRLRISFEPEREVTAGAE